LFLFPLFFCTNHTSDDSTNDKHPSHDHETGSRTE
jgi:hypothetical protein